MLKIFSIFLLTYSLHCLNFDGTRYELQLEDEILDSAIMTTLVKNKIHCATLCVENDTCVGFGIQRQSCSLLKSFVNSEICKQENCIKSPGMKIYMVRFSSISQNASFLID